MIDPNRATPVSTRSTPAITVAVASPAMPCWLTIRFVNRDGQTLAKKLLGIKVVRADGSPSR